MKKVLIACACAVLLAGCNEDELSPESVVRGAKETFTDIAEIQPIPLVAPQNGNGINCPETENDTWAVFKLKTGEVYLGAIGTLERTADDRKTDVSSTPFATNKKCFNKVVYNVDNTGYNFLVV